MIEDEQERLEAGLRRTPPAAVPPDLMERLRAAVSTQPVQCAAPRRTRRWVDWLAGWRGLTVAASAAAICLVVWPAVRPAAGPGKTKSPDLARTGPDAVQVGHSLMASFDTVAQLPDGEPVRFHYREWQDDVVIHDKANGMVISQSTPRVELVPVRFETY